MSEAELDRLPHGIIRLDPTGKILYYSASQAELAHRSKENSIGKNFFRDVAPCTSVRGFEGKFREMLTTNAARIMPFTFDFVFPWGQKTVTITMVRSADATSGYVVVSTAESGPLDMNW
jgi:photoactive yellow protein